MILMTVFDKNGSISGFKSYFMNPFVMKLEQVSEGWILHEIKYNFLVDFSCFSSLCGVSILEMVLICWIGSAFDVIVMIGIAKPVKL